MRVLIVTHQFPNPYQPNRAPWNRQQFLAAAEHHAIRIVSPISFIDEWKLSGKLGKILPPSRSIWWDGVLVEHPRYYYIPKMLRSSYGRLFYRSVRKACARAVADFCPDVILAPWAYPDGWAGIELGKAYGLPTVIKVHGSDVLSIDKYPARRQATIFTLKNADAVIAVSRHLKDRVVDLGAQADRVHVVYGGVSTNIFSPGNRNEARSEIGVGEGPMILFVGNLAAVKQVHILLDAIAELKRRQTAVQCHIIGEGPLRSALEAQACRRGISDRVVFHGAKPLCELVHWYRAANLVALPSRSEGVPNVLLEAMACGTPFVASCVGGIPEIADPRYCELVPPGDSRALADGLERALREKAPPCFTRTFHDSAIDLMSVLEGVVGSRKQSAPDCILANHLRS